LCHAARQDNFHRLTPLASMILINKYHAVRPSALNGLPGLDVKVVMLFSCT
jgi:hypothetical protein